MSDDRHDRVSRRAYELWEQEGGEHGRHQDHWHRAAAEMDDAVAPDGTTLSAAADEVTGIAPPSDAEAPAPADAEKRKPARKRPASGVSAKPPRKVK